jgi:hypothetical protein
MMDIAVSIQGGSMKKIVAYALPFMVCSLLLGARVQKQQVQASLLRLQQLQKQIHQHLELLRTKLGPEGDPQARLKLGESLSGLQAKALELRQAELKMGLTLPPVPWKRLPGNIGFDSLIQQLDWTSEDLLAMFMKLNVDDPSNNQDCGQLTTTILTLIEKMEKSAGEMAQGGEPQKPDLVVCLSWGESVPLIYQDKRITVRVKNMGQAPAPASTLRVYVKQNDAHYIPVPALNPNRMFEWSRDFHWGTCGNKVVRAWADYYGQVAELMENNNMMECELHVYCGGLGTVVQTIPVGCSQPISQPKKD